MMRTPIKGEKLYLSSRDYTGAVEVISVGGRFFHIRKLGKTHAFHVLTWNCIFSDMKLFATLEDFEAFKAEKLKADEM